MATAAPILFRKTNGQVASGATIVDHTVGASTANRQTSGSLGDPFEGELMIMWIDLMGGLGESDRAALWSSNGYTTYSAVTYENASLPNGPITVQKGWRFSTHEMWKYLVLPYLDNEIVAEVVRNGERARTWNSQLLGLPGLLASVYVRADSATSTSTYHDTMGIPPIALGYTPIDADKMSVAPYAAFALMLVDRGAGLAWHRAMLARPLMQSTLGNLDSSEAQGARVAARYTWDGKVTTDLAALGGLHDLLRTYLRNSSKLERFYSLIDGLHRSTYSTMQGTETPYAPPPDLSQ